jgi:hypothetical protein
VKNRRDRHFVKRNRLLEELEARRLLSAIDVLTQHNDNSRTSLNLSETTLNTSNVNQSTFGRLYSRAVDDEIYAQPLYVTNVNIPGKGAKNVVFVATVNDSVYAFDADDATVTDPYWKDSFIDLANNIRPVFHTDVGQACGNYVDFSGNIGIVSTPVIDKATNTIYLVARTVEGTGASQKFVQRLHALDITTGAEKFGGPVVIQASVPGTGAGSSGGVLKFNPQPENQRAALALDNGNVIITYASHCDTGPYHGWILAYNAATLNQSWALADTADGSNGGIWQSGQGPVIDSAGNMYFSVGNGTVSPATGQYGESFIRVTANGQIVDSFTPSNHQQLENGDIDFGSAGPLLIPGTRTLVSADKEGKIFFLNADNLGGLNVTDQSLQEFQVTPNFGNDKIHGAPVYFQDSSGKKWVYVWGSNDKLKQFPFNGTILSSTTPTYTSNVTVNPNPSMPGGVMAISSNGSAAGTGLLWVTTVLSGNANNDVRPGILRVFDASNVTNELWNSQENAARDDFGNLAKFNTPTVDNGKVYLATFSDQLVVYGLLSGLPVAPASLTATVAASGVDVDLAWSAVTGAVQYAIERRSGSSGNFVPIATVDGSVTSYHDGNLVGGTAYYYRVRAQNANGASSPVEAMATTVLAKQLFARFRFDENSGNVANDASGHNNTGLISVSGTTWTTGRFGSALLFNGSTNAYVTVADSPTLNPSVQMSAVAWINANSWANGNHRILQKGSGDDEYRLTAEGGVLKWDIKNVGTVTTALPSTGVWHLVVGTFDGVNVRLYVDGAQVASVAATAGATIPSTTDPLVIGSKNTNSVAGDHFDGKIDDVRIYNYGLSAAEVATLNAGVAPAMPTGLSLSAPSPSNVALLWNDVANNEGGYLVERRLASGGAYMQVASLPAGATGYNDTGLPPFTTYFYRVRAYNVFDSSAYTPEQSVTTQGAAIHSLVARFTLDESSGTSVADSSGHGILAALIGAPTHPTDTPDASSHSLGLNGSTDWAQAPDNAALDMTDALTLAAWVKADTWDQTRPILQKGGRETHYVLEADGGLLKFDLTNQGTLTAPLPSTGVWHYLAATYDGANMKIYVDGEVVASRAASGTLGTTPEPFFIGGSHASASTSLTFAGKIDDARVYNYALVPTEVSGLYGNVAYLRFDEGSGNNTIDSTPNNNNGLYAGDPGWIYSRDGYALNFSAGNYVILNNNQTINPTSAISAAAWINPTGWTGTPAILQKGVATVQYRIYASDGNVIFDLPGVGSVATALPPVGEWHFVTGTYDGSALKLYVDGVVKSSLVASGVIKTTSDPLIIGAADQSGNAATTFDGAIDGVRLFSRGLTPEEVVELYNAPTLDLTPPTVAEAQYVYQSSPNSISVTFSENVSGLDAGSLTIMNLTTGASYPASTYDFNTTTHVATFGFASIPPVGNYHATLAAGVAKDASGNTMQSPLAFDFYSLPGDANRDRSVDFNDLVALAQNYNTVGKTYAQGDFTGDGSVDFNDLVQLAQNYNTSLAATGAASAGGQLTSIAAAPMPSLASVLATLDKPDRSSTKSLPKTQPAAHKPAPVKHIAKPSSNSSTPSPILATPFAVRRIQPARKHSELFD